MSSWGRGARGVVSFRRPLQVAEAEARHGKPWLPANNADLSSLYLTQRPGCHMTVLSRGPGKRGNSHMYSVLFFFFRQTICNCMVGCLSDDLVT